MIADRRWDTGELLPGRKPRDDYMAHIRWALDQGPENVCDEDMGLLLDDLYCFKGWLKRSYAEAIEGQKQVQELKQDMKIADLRNKLQYVTEHRDRLLIKLQRISAIINE
jgi:hypothetical protein